MFESEWRLTDCQANTPAPKGCRFRRDTSYLLTGGNGGVGGNLCRWLARAGAGQVVVISSSGAKPEKIKLLKKEMVQCGAQLHLLKCDISDPIQMAKLFEGMKDQRLPPIRRVFHCAMVLQVNRHRLRLSFPWGALAYTRRAHS